MECKRWLLEKKLCVVPSGRQNFQDNGQYEDNDNLFFLDNKGIGHKKFVPSDRTVNAEFSVDPLRPLRESVSRRPSDQSQHHT